MFLFTRTRAGKNAISDSMNVNILTNVKIAHFVSHDNYLYSMYFIGILKKFYTCNVTLKAHKINCYLVKLFPSHLYI